MTLLESFLAALSAAIVVMTIVQTAAAYPSLPDRVPLNFGWDGRPRGYGPRAAIWFIVAVQIFAASVMAFADYALATHAPGTHGTLLGSLVASVPALTMFWGAQRVLISCAKNGEAFVQTRRFAGLVAVSIALVLLAAFAIH